MLNNSKILDIKKIEERALNGDSLTVVFLGGSLTWGANASNPNITSWRGRTMKMLREKYPQARWTFYDAAIGGTGSALGIFRLERDVLAYKPDLVLLDFTLNDGLEGSDYANSDLNNHSYESIIRRCLENCVAILPVFLTAKKYVEIDNLAELKRRQQHIYLCDHYHLYYADVLGCMNTAFHSNEIELDSYWPEQLFDTTHPHDEGYAAYSKCFNIEWDRIVGSASKDVVLPEESFFGESYKNISRINFSELSLPGGWGVDFPYWQSDTFDWMTSRWVDRVALGCNASYKGYGKYEQSTNTAESLTLKFQGEIVSLIAEVVPESAELEISIDSGEPFSVKSRPAAISQIQHIPIASGLDPQAVHTLTIRVLQTTGKICVARLGSVLIAGSQFARLVI